MMKKIINFFKNYWYYYKTPAIVVAFILFLIGFIAYERLSFVKPDMIIDCISDNVYFTSNDIENICTNIENSGALQDINGDEKKKTVFNTYTASASQTSIGTEGGSTIELVGVKMAMGDSAIIVADRKVLEKYEKYNIYQDLSEIANKLYVPEEDRLYSSEGVLVGIRMDNRGIMKKLGIGHKEVFLTLRVSMESVDVEMAEQAPYVAEYMLK